MAYPFPTHILDDRFKISREYLLEIVKDYVKDDIGCFVVDKKAPGGFWARVTPLAVWDDNQSIEVVGIYWDPRVPKVSLSSHYTLARIDLTRLAESELRASILANPYNRDNVIQIGSFGEEGELATKEVHVSYSLAEETFPYQLALAGHIVKTINGVEAYEDWGKWVNARLMPQDDAPISHVTTEGNMTDPAGGAKRAEPQPCLQPGSLEDKKKPTRTSHTEKEFLRAVIDEVLKTGGKTNEAALDKVSIMGLRGYDLQSAWQLFKDLKVKWKDYLSDEISKYDERERGHRKK